MTQRLIIAKLIRVKGKVQGVGFRPFIYKHAIQNNLVGYVLNNSSGVEILVQGEDKDIINFEKQLSQDPPKLAEITSIKTTKVPVQRELASFEIKKSSVSLDTDVLISPDVATCPLCEKELFDPEDRRFLFPFINCTDCGPRFTITKKIPYDRKNTSMSCFSMCEKCYTEYTDPLNRRFHAQPNCCPECGPRIYLLNREKKLIAEGTNAIEYVSKELLNNKIVAIKGLGGFHICCSAQSKDTILRLRNLKKRPYKPFALMAMSIQDIEKIAHISDREREILLGNIRPILLVQKKGDLLPEEIAPDTKDIGIMLPYTPLHHILFYFYKKGLPKDKLPILIMTSGNLTSQPICTGNREAISKLKDFVDYILTHNRDILIRCDDSVVKVLKNRQIFYRRARGYVPYPIFLKNHYSPSLGVGAELKNTICLINKDKAFVSQYIGDLKNLETYNFFLDTIKHFKDIFRIQPKAIGADLHPDYMSTRYVLEQKEVPVIQIQHHHSHILSVIAENKIEEDVIGISLDGSGLGEDKTIWGGEIFIVFKDLSYKRVGHLFPIKLPGKESAIKNIWKIGLSYLYEAGVSNIEKYLPSISIRDKSIVLKMLDNNINCISTTSCGRLFDAISALLGLKTNITYEGEGAIALENIQDKTTDKSYYINTLDQKGRYVVDTISLIEDILKDMDNHIPPSLISRKFHLGLCRVLSNIAYNLSKHSGIKKVALSGGVFQNQTISEYMEYLLIKKGLTPLFNLQLSPNDENISLGQAYFVARNTK